MCRWQVLIMGAATTTIHCYTRKEISDVVTTKEPWLATDNDWVPTDYHCNRSENHRAELRICKPRQRHPPSPELG